MLKQLEWTHEIFAMLYTTIRTLDTISEAVLMYIYQAILEIAEEMSAGRKDAAQEKIKKMGEVLIAIRKQEEVERAREWNPDELLKKI